MATQKISMGRGKDTDYESKKAAALAQAGQNDFINCRSGHYGQCFSYVAVSQFASVLKSSESTTDDVLDPEATYKASRVGPPIRGH